MSESRSKSSSPQKQQDNPQISQDNNCKVYVSNIHRDTKDQQLRQLFNEFGDIDYFVVKRKPNDVVYAFIQFKTHEAAQQAILKTNRSMYHQRTLNVQFGRGGKHQQQHYQTINLVPSKNRQPSDKDRYDSSRRYQRRDYNDYDRRPRQPYRGQYRQYKRSFSPPGRYDSRRDDTRRDYRRQGPPRQYDDQRYGYERYPDIRDSRRRIDDDRFVKDRPIRRYSPQRSPRNQRGRQRQSHRQKDRKYYQDLHHERGPRYDERRQQYPRKRYDQFPINRDKPQKYYKQRDDDKNYRSRPNDQFPRQKFRDQRGSRGFKNQRQRSQRSPYHERYQKGVRQDDRKVGSSRTYDKSTRYPDNRSRQREQYEKVREYKRSRSRQTSKK